MKITNFICGSIVFLSLNFANAYEQKSTNRNLIDLLIEAEKNSPQTEIDRQLSLSFDEEVKVQKSKYYPSLNGALITSTGNIGSFALMDVDNNISSSNRIGYGGALIAKQNIWDFGRTTNAIQSAEIEKKLITSKAFLSKLNIDEDLVDTYINCAFLKTQIANSNDIVQRLKIVANEIEKFVHAGQRSIIESYLVDSEKKAAETRVAEFSEKLRVTEVRLGILIAKKAIYKVSCNNLENIDNEISIMEKKTTVNPMLEIEKIKTEFTESQLAASKAEYMPEIFAMGMFGYFSNDHLSEKQNYAIGLGLKFPIFDGHLIDSRVAKKDAELIASRESIKYSMQNIDKINATYEEKINSLAVRLKFLEEEKKHAKKVFDLAHKRYEASQGSMVDLRDSIQNMNRLSLAVDETSRDYYLARAEKSLFDGFKISDSF